MVQDCGNLVILSADGSTVWHSDSPADGTNGPYTATLDAEGCFHVTDKGGAKLWECPTRGAVSASLDGKHFVLKGFDGHMVWTSQGRTPVFPVYA